MHGFSLEGKIAVVTGAGTGIGRAIAVEFARFGADVVVHYRSSAREAEAVVDQIHSMGRKSIALKADLTREEEVAAFVAGAQEFGGGRIDIAVNNAGNIFDSVPVAEMPAELWQKTMEVNMTSTFLMCRQIVPVMKSQGGGRIINMASLAAHNGGGRGTTPYAASKAAVQAFSKGLAKEVAPDILVNCIAPGIIDTRIHQAYLSDTARTANLERIPLRREGRPEELAGAAILLASAYGSYITGETIEVNGGIYMD